MSTLSNCTAMGYVNIPQTERVLAAVDVGETPQANTPESSRYASAHSNHSPLYMTSLYHWYCTSPSQKCPVNTDLNTDVNMKINSYSYSYFTNKQIQIQTTNITLQNWCEHKTSEVNTELTRCELSCAINSTHTINWNHSDLVTGSGTATACIHMHAVAVLHFGVRQRGQ